MILALDTSILIDLERGNTATIVKLRQLSQEHQSPACIPFMVYVEFYWGLLNRNAKNKNQALEFLQKFPLLHTSQKTAETLAELRKSLEQKGIQLAYSDLFIASQIKEHKLLFITKDKDFTQITDIEKIIL